MEELSKLRNISNDLLNNSKKYNKEIENSLIQQICSVIKGYYKGGKWKLKISDNDFIVKIFPSRTSIKTQCTNHLLSILNSNLSKLKPLTCVLIENIKINWAINSNKLYKK